MENTSVKVLDFPPFLCLMRTTTITIVVPIRAIPTYNIISGGNEPGISEVWPKAMA
jgi:hypothetical protein